MLCKWMCKINCKLNLHVKFFTADYALYEGGSESSVIGVITLLIDMIG